MLITRRSRGLSLLLGAMALASAGSRALPAHAAAPPATTAVHASTPAERQARGEAAARAFVAGRYDEALATYLDLYVQSDGRPEYLRNIGRCQQKLRQYARAIDSFKEYLRRNRKLTPDERQEVQGFISEMQTALAADEKAAAAPPPTPTPAVVPPPEPTRAPAPSPAAPSPAAPSPAAPHTIALARPPAASPDSSPPTTQLLAHTPAPAAGQPSALRPAGIVAVVAAGAAAVGGVIALLRSRSIFDDASKAGCHDGGGPTSFCNGKADSVETSNTVSKILFVSAGALGVAGVAMIAIAPSPDARVGLLVTGRF